MKWSTSLIIRELKRSNQAVSGSTISKIRKEMKKPGANVKKNREREAHKVSPHRGE